MDEATFVAAARADCIASDPARSSRTTVRRRTASASSASSGTGASGTRPLPSLLAPLRARNFRLLFFGRAVSFAGSAMAPVALAFAVLELGRQATDLGLVLSLAILPQVFFLLVGGVIADRVPRTS